MDSQPWIWRGKELNWTIITTGKYKAMSYLITCLAFDDPLYYIGKKQFYFRRKGRTVSSDWEKYWSSSDEVKRLLKEFGVESFTREVLALHRTFAASNYTERELLYKFRVIESDKFINRSIDGKYGKINRSGSMFNETHPIFSFDNMAHRQMHNQEEFTT